MKERAAELKTARRGGKTDGNSEVLTKIAEMPEPDRLMAERVHEIVRAAAPGLAPRTWYGMPAYARDGDVVCFFQSASKFKARYATLGFSDKARLDDGEASGLRTAAPSAFGVRCRCPRERGCRFSSASS
jgi:uncharacterized protein YdhG (YjbR/CyaY superfamily)